MAYDHSRHRGPMIPYIRFFFDLSKNNSQEEAIACRSCDRPDFCSTLTVRRLRRLVGGCGRFLGGRTKRFGCVQSRGTQAGGGTLSHDINDDGRSGRTSRLSDQTVHGTPAG